MAPALIYASPVLLLWVLSPSFVWWINRPITEHTVPLNEEQINLLRQVTRRTWGFFERFVGPEDHWLPPDHFQEVACRNDRPPHLANQYRPAAHLDPGSLRPRLSGPTRAGNPPGHHDGHTRPVGALSRALFELV